MLLVARMLFKLTYAMNGEVLDAAFIDNWVPQMRSLKGYGLFKIVFFYSLSVLDNYFSLNIFLPFVNLLNLVRKGFHILCGKKCLQKNLLTNMVLRFGS